LTKHLLEWYAYPTTPYAKPKRDARIIVTCASGGRSMLAAETLWKIGYTDVVNMAGGFNAWSKQGFPIEGHKLGTTVWSTSLL
jgi:rhodanese-related sulfurtransferase